MVLGIAKFVNKCRRTGEDYELTLVRSIDTIIDKIKYKKRKKVSYASYI